MHYKIKTTLLILCLNIFWSCLPDLIVEEYRDIAIIDLLTDIHVYSNTSIDIESSKIYNTDGEYYFGNFYYPTKDSIYILDIFNKRIISIDNNNKKEIIPVDYQNIEESSIVLVDDNNIYLKGSTVVFTENIEITNIIITSPVINPEIEYEEINTTTSVSEIYTNYNKVDTISLTKLDKNGDFIFQINNIAINDDSSRVLKVIPSVDSGFAIFKHSNSEAILNMYDSNGEFEKSILLSTIESIDTENNSYKEIMDIAYIKANKIFMILVMSVKDGVYGENIIYTIDTSTSKVKKLQSFKRDDTMIPIGITDIGVIVSSGFENGNYFLIKESASMSEYNIKEPLKSNNTLRNLKTFNDGVYAFRLTNSTVTFYGY